MASYPKITRDITEPATIGDLQVDVVVSKETTFDSEVTQYPVEDGFPVADHVTRNPMALTMEVVCTPTPVTFFADLGANQNRLNEVTNAIMKIYNEGDPITVKTADAIYKDMVMTHAPLPRTVDDGLCYKMQLDFVHVRRVKPKTEDVPEGQTSSEAEGKAGESEKDGGTADQNDIGTGMTTVDNTATVEVDTSFQDYSNMGNILTGQEITAFVCASVISRIL
jgi:hypothetical protein